MFYNRAMNVVTQKPSRAWVLLLGLTTTLLALAGVFWLNRHTDDFHVMGWYADYVIPAGSLLVGAAAGSGYGIGSWWSGLKIRRGLLLLVMLLQLGAYGAAEWLEFRAIDFDEPRPSFAAYYHYKATSFAWKRHGSVGEPIGAWGYLFLGLAAAGFVAGGVLVPALLAKAAYCDRCQVYMRRRHLAWLPASVPPRKVKSSDAEGRAAFERDNQEATDQTNRRLERIGELAAKGDGLGISADLAGTAADAKGVKKLPTRVAVELVHCRSCLSSYVQASVHRGHGKRLKIERLSAITAGPDVTRTLAR